MALDRDPNHVLRDFVIPGMPSSGKWNVHKPEFRALLTEWWQTLIALVADAGGLELPNLLIRLDIIDGTPNAIQATPNLPPPTAPGTALFSIVTETPNTGNVTINGKPLLTSGGNQILPGGLVPGAWLILDDGDQYRLLSDQASAAIQSAIEQLLHDTEAAASAANSDADRSETARDIAEGFASDIVSQGNVPIYATAAGLSSLTIPDGISSIRTNGYYASGDGGGAKYRLRSALEVDGLGDQLSNGNTKRWALAEPSNNFYMLGAVPGESDAASLAANNVAIQAAFDLSIRHGLPIVQPDGDIHFDQQIHIHGPHSFSGLSRAGNKLVWHGTGHAFRFENTSPDPYGSPTNGVQFFSWEKFTIDMSVSNYEPCFSLKRLIQFGHFRDFDVIYRWSNPGSTPSDLLPKKTFDFTDETEENTYKGYVTWENFMIHYADHAFYIPPGSRPVNAMRVISPTFEGCIHSWYQLENANAGRGLHDFINWGVQMSGESRTQVCLEYIIGVSIVGGWWETKTGLDEFIPGNYNTKNFIQAGPNSQGIQVQIPRMIPSTQGRTVLLRGRFSTVFTSGVKTGSEIYRNNPGQGVATRIFEPAYGGQTQHYLEFKNEIGGIPVAGVNPNGVYFNEPVNIDTTGSTLAIDASRSPVQRIWLNHNITNVVINNRVRGQELELFLISNGGARTISGWPSYVKLAGGAFAPTSVDGRGDVLRFRWDGTRLYETGRSVNVTMF